MIVAAASESFPGLSFQEMLERLVDLEYTALDLAICEQDSHLKPSEIHADLPHAIDMCRSTKRITLQPTKTLQVSTSGTPLTTQRTGVICHRSRARRAPRPRSWYRRSPTLSDVLRIITNCVSSKAIKA